jgi:hypothetical protein
VNSDEFDVGHGHALGLQQQVTEILIAAASVPSFLSTRLLHALAYRTHEKGRSNVAQAPPAANELFQGKKAVFQRRGRGAEQQSQSNHEKIVWLSHLPRPGTRALPPRAEFRAVWRIALWLVPPLGAATLALLTIGALAVVWAGGASKKRWATHRAAIHAAGIILSPEDAAAARSVPQCAAY